jgi:hypothetical protein
MGCDIHGYIEVKSEWWDGYQDFADLHLNRNYAIFALLAGVRDYEEWGAVIKPKGFPLDSDNYDYWLWIAEDSESGCCTLENAEKWVAQKHSIWHPNDEKKIRVSSPDWHTASWLSKEELQKVINRYEELVSEQYKLYQYYAILAVLQAIPDSRFLFWFDD